MKRTTEGRQGQCKSVADGRQSSAHRGGNCVADPEGERRAQKDPVVADAKASRTVRGVDTLTSELQLCARGSRDSRSSKAHSSQQDPTTNVVREGSSVTQSRDGRLVQSALLAVPNVDQWLSVFGSVEPPLCLSKDLYGSLSSTTTASGSSFLRSTLPSTLLLGGASARVLAPLFLGLLVFSSPVLWLLHPTSLWTVKLVVDKFKLDLCTLFREPTGEWRRRQVADEHRPLPEFVGVCA